MGDYGAKASVKGYDVNNVTDYLQLFNSSWPHLKIEHGAQATITLNSTPQTIYTHDLGYPPLYLIISGGKFTSFAGIRYRIGVDSTALVYDGSHNVGGTFTFYYYICRLPLNQNFTSDNIPGSVLTTDTSNDYGLKVTKPGKDIASTDLRDYALYSSSRSLMVHKVDYGATTASGGDYVRTVPHGLNYIPIGFCFMKFGAGGVAMGYNPSYTYAIPPPAGVQDSNYTLDDTNMNIFANGSFLTGNADATAVFLKDPFAKETVNVSFP